jgi:putative flippase GtrA
MPANETRPMKHRLAEVLRFGIVGGIGFLVDAGVLMLLTGPFGWPPLPSRIASFPPALTATWILNRLWTFRNTGGKRAAGPQYAIYAGIQLTGMAINFIVYAALVSFGGLFVAQPVLALAAGSIVAMGFNYLVSRRFAFTA